MHSVQPEEIQAHAMIVDPDFLTHWKTQMLIVELNDKAAPLYVISLWAHCQQRRQDRWDVMHPNALKAICRYEGEASKLRAALERSGFVDANGDGIIVHGWAEVNAKLIAQWVNGVKGGRKPSKPTGNPKSNWVNPPGTDREDRIGEEKRISDPPNLAPSAPAGEVKAHVPRPRNELFDVLARSTGSDPYQVTGTGGASIGKALADIRKVFPDVTPAEIERRAEAYRKLHPAWDLTAPALAKHWAACVPGSTTPPPKDYSKF